MLTGSVSAVGDRYRELRRILPPVYWTVWLGTLINRAGGFVVPLLTFYLTEERHLSLSEAGAIVSLFGAGQVGAALTGGVLADRLGRRATMVISLLGGAITMIALGLARTEASIAAAVLALGFVGELYRPAVAAFIADVIPPEHRLRAYGFLYWAINLGFSIAPLAAGLVAGWSYLALFLIDGATMLVYGVIVLVKVPETRPAAPHHDEPRTQLVDVLADGVFVRFCILTFLVAFITFQHSATLSGWMSAQGHGPRTFGAVIAVNGILIVLLQPAITSWIRRFDTSRALAAAALITGIGFSLHGTTSVIPVHIVAVAIWTMGEIAASPMSAAVVAGLATPDARGRYQGVHTMSWGFASFAGPFLGPRILEHGGPLALWGGCAALGALIALGFLATSRSLRARMRSA
jgi:MFS family permease